MFSHALTSTLALAGAASALMVPPSIPPAAMAEDPLALSKQPPSPAPVANGQPRATIELACPSCPLAVGQIHGHPVKWADGPDTRLLIELTSDGSQLYFNGAPIYPLAPTKLGRRLMAKQLYMDPNDPLAVEDLYDRPLPLSTGIEVYPSLEMVTFHMDASRIKDIVELVPMRSLDIEIMGLGEKLIKVDTIRVKFSDDKLEIHDVNIVPYGTNDSDAEKSCDTVLCRLRADLESKLAALKEKVGSAAEEIEGTGNLPKTGCDKHHKKPAAAAEANPEDSPESNPPSRPAGMPLPGMIPNALPGSIKSGLRKVNGKLIKGHNTAGRFPGFKGGVVGVKGGMDENLAGVKGHRHHHHRHDEGVHGFLHSAVNFLYHIIIPVMVGIAAGMLVSAVGMVIGQAVVWTCNTIWGPRAEYQKVGLVLVDVEDWEDEEEEFLPRYEDVNSDEPPAFEEKEVLQ